MRSPSAAQLAGVLVELEADGVAFEQARFGRGTHAARVEVDIRHVAGLDERREPHLRREIRSVDLERLDEADEPAAVEEALRGLNVFGRRVLYRHAGAPVALHRPVL